eukprot:scaffold1437_cov113-Cylindrotheca_fusiformis.AAC.6
MTVGYAMLLGGIPASTMLACTAVGLNREVPHNITGAVQHFAAGILICSIGTELLPAMKDARSAYEILASAIGFFSGVALMIVVGILFPEEEDDSTYDGSSEDEKREDAKELFEKVGVGRKQFGRSSSMAGRRNSLISKAYKRGSAPASSRPGASIIAEEDTPLMEHETGYTEPFPAAFVVTVCVDSVVDGLLIGIAAAASPTAGPMLAISLCVEMGFLGCTLATALAKQPTKYSVPASFLGPLLIVVGSTIGGLLSSALSGSPLAMTGLLSFGVSALLFMVAEELLLEAHENGNEHVWWVDLQLYNGFFVSIMLGKFIPE